MAQFLIPQVWQTSQGQNELLSEGCNHGFIPLLLSLVTLMVTSDPQMSRTEPCGLIMGMQAARKCQFLLF